MFTPLLLPVWGSTRTHRRCWLAAGKNQHKHQQAGSTGRAGKQSLPRVLSCPSVGQSLPRVLSCPSVGQIPLKQSLPRVLSCPSAGQIPLKQSLPRFVSPPSVGQTLLTAAWPLRGGRWRGHPTGDADRDLRAHPQAWAEDQRGPRVPGAEGGEAHRGQETGECRAAELCCSPG